MKSFYRILFALLAVWVISACNPSTTETETETQTEEDDFSYLTEQFADLKIIRYKAEGFENLPLEQKKLLYYLYEAALSGRDIIYDQKYKHNLCVRRTLENIVNTYKGDRDAGGGSHWNEFMVYTKRVWFSNGIHHHYSTKKFAPEFDAAYFEELVRNSDEAGFPLEEGETLDDLIAKLNPVLFDPSVDTKLVNKAAGVDMIAESANNFYEGVTQAEVEAFYKEMKTKANAGSTPVAYGLNSKVVKENGQVVEKVWKVGGMYNDAIVEIVNWLEKASSVAENDKQKAAFDLLVKYYKSGDLKDFDDYNIAWVQDTDSDIDVINGFIEVYGDALGYKGSFESVVEIKDPEASAAMAVVAENAQWFEDNSSIMDEHKKKEVTGISYNMINVVMEAGDASPSTPIGINLPNSNWIRKDHGSKSISLSNIEHAYDKAGGKGMLAEFAYNEEEIQRSKKHSDVAGKLHTALHEVIGHASGQINEGVGTPKETMKNYASTLEEARADLVALYFLMDQKLIDLGLMESLDVGKTEYDGYIRNGMMLQLRRLEIGEEIEEDHMRNRQLVAAWAFEKGQADNVISKEVREGKTYFHINDYEKCRVLFGDLLREIQRIKSEGDFEAAEALVEGYGVKVDPELHAEVLKRVEPLKSAPYGGFINPKLIPVTDDNGNITDVRIEYPDDFTQQHLEYSKTHSFLPTYN